MPRNSHARARHELLRCLQECGPMAFPVLARSFSLWSRERLAAVLSGAEKDGLVTRLAGNKQGQRRTWALTELGHDQLGYQEASR